MANLKETADKALHKETVEVDGIKVEVDTRLKDDFNLIMALGGIRNLDITALQDVLDIVLGDQKARVLNELQDEDGFLSFVRVNQFIGQVLEAAGLKN